MKPIRLALFSVLILSMMVLAACSGSEGESAADIVPTNLQQTELSSRPAAVSGSSAAAAALVGGPLENSLVDVYRNVNDAVVFIQVPPLGSGSGFYYGDGYIVTNNHVVDGGTQYEVVFANGERRRGELAGKDADSDLAVLRVDDVPAGIEPLPLDDEGIQVGQFVVAIGNPFGEQGSMSFGIVSGLGRSLRSQRAESGNTYSLPQVIQTDAPINPGNSGGPLLDLEGEVVGVNSAIATTTGVGSGVGFSIPVAAVRQIVPSLIANGSYTYPYMGAGFTSELSLQGQEALGLPDSRGVYVTNIVSGSPAERAGLIAADPQSGLGGDLIVALDGVPVADFSDLNSYLVFNTQIGDTIVMRVWRSGELIEVPLTLGARP